MSTTNRQLMRELELAGANAKEVVELTSLADKLRLLKPSVSRHSNRFVNILKPVLLPSLAVVVGLFMVMLAQSVRPTSWLYPIQKLSDAVATEIHPEYRADVMMRRAQQVNQLVSSHASTDIILSTLASYKAEAEDYRSMPHANYAAFEYCKTNLEQAAATAPSNIRQAIVSSLNALRNI